MKYQQLEGIESVWKLQYILKKSKDGVRVTRYVPITSEEQIALIELENLSSRNPISILNWIENHMSLELDNKLKQAIRAKRKRHFNATQLHTRKKSIDLDYRVWEKLSSRAHELESTLSDTIEYLLTEASLTEKVSQAVLRVKDDLKKLIG